MDTEESKRETSVSKSLLKGFKCKSTQRSNNRGITLIPYKPGVRAPYLKKQTTVSEIATVLRQAEINSSLKAVAYFYQCFTQSSGIHSPLYN